MRFIAVISLFIMIVSVNAFAYSEPTCQELNNLWRTKYSQDFYFTWEHVELVRQRFMNKFDNKFFLFFSPAGTTIFDEQFPCPDTDADENEISHGRFSYYHAAKQFNMLDQVDIIDPQGNESFDYYSYVTSGVDSMRLRLDDLDVFEAQGEDGFGDILLPNRFFRESSIQGPSALVHERRHFDNDNVARAHVICDSGESQGTQNCDDYNPAWENGGAYHYDLMYLLGVATNANLTDLQRRSAKWYLTYEVSNSFNGLSNTEAQRILDMIPE